MLLRSVLLLLVLPAAAAAQATPSPAAAPASAERGVYLTVFRNPSSGLEARFGRIGLHAGYYPTILKADGETDGRNTNFIRIGGTIYSHPRGLSAYLTTSVAISLDDRFDNGVLTDAGVRAPIAGPVSGRLGAGVLTTFDGEVRVNPTIGLDIRLGRRR